MCASCAPLLQTIVQTAFPRNGGLLYAFGYGSVVIPQHGRSTANSQLDLVLIVKDPLSWHLENCAKNPHHYSRISQRFNHRFLKLAVSKWPSPAVYYNPLIEWTDPNNSCSPQLLKYGVVGLTRLLQDLNSWSDLYIAGRLHKPVAWIPVKPLPKHDESAFALALSHNLTSALAFALLQHDFDHSGPLSETELYRSLASISYRGDWRLYLGEDRKKIERLISGVPRRRAFRSLYLPYLNAAPFSELFDVAVPSSLSIDFIIEPRHRDGYECSPCLLALLPDQFCTSCAAGGVGDTPAAARCHLQSLSYAQRSALLSATAASVVRWASYRQTLLGIFSAGIGRSFTYSLEKFKKMLASLYY
uniref:Phosphatidate cytidylyltransferase, mitochondrial n=1 Tax=Schistocephalus solidus TaxID=70667 RepID=A0A0X3Q4J8_SCHSO